MDLYGTQGEQAGMLRNGFRSNFQEFGRLEADELFLHHFEEREKPHQKGVKCNK
jgi:hypothetical protein